MGIAVVSVIGLGVVLFFTIGRPAAGRSVPLAPLPFSLRRIAAAKNPTAIAAGTLAGGSTVLFITQQDGEILAVEPGGVARLVLTIPELVSGGERGLLGIALAPDWPADPRAFVNYTDSKGSTGLSTVLASIPLPPAGSVDAASARAGLREILRFEQPYSNHNSGSLTFGPDGFLYMGVGDGGSAGDPQGHGQDLGDWLGSVLRIDVIGGSPYRVPADNPFVHTGGALPEIWAYGLRNPWGLHFDSGGDHALWIADVGQDTYEEIDRGVAGGNYGWNVREGKHAFKGAGAGPFVEPVAEYSHAVGVSVTGGVVCRDPSLPSLIGTYLYADFGTGVFFGLRDGVVTLYGPSELHPSTFTEDAQGRVYVADYMGGIYQLTGR